MVTIITRHTTVQAIGNPANSTPAFPKASNTKLINETQRQAPQRELDGILIRIAQYSQNEMPVFGGNLGCHSYAYNHLRQVATIFVTKL